MIFQMGNTPWNKGKKGVQKSWNKGKTNIYTKEALLKMSKVKKGKLVSEKTKERLSQAMSGKNNPMYGENHTEETKRKISECRIKKGLGKGKNNSMYGIHRWAEKSPNWKGNITPLTIAIRMSTIYKLWHKAVLHKDRWQCQDCGKTGRDLIAHHLKPFSQIMEENNIVSLGQAIRTEELWDINNGITLCKQCHRKRHSKGKKYGQHH